MLTTIEHKTLLLLLVAGSCSAIINVAAPARESAAASLSAHATITTTSATTELGTCYYAAQLASDPELRAAYTVQTRQPSVEADDSDLYVSSIDAGAKDTGSTNSRTDIDSFSNGCLSCHDGVIAQDFKLRVKNDPSGRVMSLEDITGGHPVGMDYETYVTANGAVYNNTVSFSKEMVFADGKIGCLTCHNPLNETKGHLVMNNDKSDLCFACHSK